MRIPAYNGAEISLNSDLCDLISEQKLDVDGNIVLLTKANSDKVEALISKDDSYIDFGRIVFEYCKGYKWPFSKDEYMRVLRAIDLVNLTNVWRYGKKDNYQAMRNIVNYVSDPQNKFVEKVSAGDIEVVDEIRKISGGTDGNNDGKHSFASKVCKYFDEYINDNGSGSYENKFYIDDFYIRRMLPYYLAHYGLVEVQFAGEKRPKKLTSSTMKFASIAYGELHKFLEELRIRSGNVLTRSQIDHIIWYCYKSYKDTDKEEK